MDRCTKKWRWNSSLMVNKMKWLDGSYRHYHHNMMKKNAKCPVAITQNQNQKKNSNHSNGWRWFIHARTHTRTHIQNIRMSEWMIIIDTTTTTTAFNSIKKCRYFFFLSLNFYFQLWKKKSVTLFFFAFETRISLFFSPTNHISIIHRHTPKNHSDKDLKRNHI